MSLLKSIMAVLPGFGHAGTYQKREGVATNSGGDTTITVPASGSLTPTLSKGMIRVKTATVGVNATVLLKSVTATDGSTTISLYAPDSAASSAGVGIERVIPFCTDLNLTSISVVLTVGTANCTHDVEVAGNS